MLCVLFLNVMQVSNKVLTLLKEYLHQAVKIYHNSSFTSLTVTISVFHILQSSKLIYYEKIVEFLYCLGFEYCLRLINMFMQSRRKCAQQA